MIVQLKRYLMYGVQYFSWKNREGWILQCATHPCLRRAEDRIRLFNPFSGAVIKKVDDKSKDYNTYIFRIAGCKE